MIERDKEYLKLFYADGHSEMLLDNIQKYIVKINTGYKNPIYLQEQQLYPTTNYENENCIWIHFDYFEEYCHLLLPFLKKRNITNMVKRMYLKHVEKRLNEKGLV